MRKYILIVFIGMVSTVLSGGAFAESLEEAWSIGLQVDHTIKAAEQDTISVQANLDAAKGARLPTVNVGAGYRVLDNEPVSLAGATQFSTADDTSLSYHAMASLPIYTHFQISSTIDAAAAVVSASKFTEQSVSQSIKLKIAEAYVTVLLRMRQVEVAGSQEQSLSAHAVDVQNLYDEGMVPFNDLLAAKVALANAQQTTLQAQNSLDVAKSHYNRFLGRSLDHKFELDEIPLVFPDVGLDNLTADALKTRSELDSLKNQVEALTWQAKAEKAVSGPKLELVGGYDYNENSHQLHEGVWQAMARVSWDIFDGNIAKNRGVVFSAKSSAATEKLNELRAIIRLQVRQSWLDIDESRKRIAVAETALDQSDENLNVTRNRYREGIGTNTEVLDAESMRTVSHVRYDTAVHDAALAIIRLHYAVGDL